mgnify:CR=1 FL=1
MIAKNIFIKFFRVYIILAYLGGGLAAAAPAEKANALHFFPLQQKNTFAEISAFYGSLSDGGTNLTPFAQTLITSSPTNPVENYTTKLGFNWGYQATLGYYLTENHHYALITSFFNLDNQRTVSASTTGDESYLYNELTQFGNASEMSNLGFSTFNAESSASSTASIQYQRLVLHLAEPWSDLEDTSKIFDFHKAKGIMMIRVAKGVTGDYVGPVLRAFDGGLPVTTPGSDSILYASNALGIGPELGFIANGKLTNYLKLHVTSETAILVGYYNAHYRENAEAKEPIRVGDNRSTSYTNTENNPSVAWTPIFFSVQALLEAKLWESKKYHSILNGAGGLGGEYILPTFTNNGVTELLGTPLTKFNNNLSASYVMMRLSLNTD